ncbi:MAG: hypothetical protein ACKOZZ_17585, partial [Bacteroidota bacterium]
MLKLFIFSCSFLIFGSPCLFSQHKYQISGKITDEMKSEIAFIQVQLFTIKAEKVQLETFTWADSAGFFILHCTEPIFRGFICLNGIGWQTDTLLLESPVFSSFFLGNIQLKSVPVNLDEIMIKE